MVLVALRLAFVLLRPILHLGERIGTVSRRLASAMGYEASLAGRQEKACGCLSSTLMESVKGGWRSAARSLRDA